MGGGGRGERPGAPLLGGGDAPGVPLRTLQTSRPEATLVQVAPGGGRARKPASPFYPRMRFFLANLCPPSSTLDPRLSDACCTPVNGALIAALALALRLPADAAACPSCPAVARRGHATAARPIRPSTRLSRRLPDVAVFEQEVPAHVRADQITQQAPRLSRRHRPRLPPATYHPCRPPRASGINRVGSSSQPHQVQTISNGGGA